MHNIGWVLSIESGLMILVCSLLILDYRDDRKKGLETLGSIRPVIKLLGLSGIVFLSGIILLIRS